jgi:ABC-type Fe3+/spermidine/putrescine transport system ATPase subunit
MMFQSYALWPHKNVFDNVAYGLSLRGLPKDKVREAVMRSLVLVGLEKFADRFPSMLSGGQQQRVALARSAVVEPKVLLLDEPLSNLDAKLREQMRVELRQLVKTLRMTAVHITHDQSEAMAIADTVIYMRQGRIEQEGSPRSLYRSPRSRFVAQFVGSATFLDGTISKGAFSREVSVQIDDTLSIVARPPEDSAVPSDATIALRPEALKLSAVKPEGLNVFPARVISEIFLGDSTEYVLSVGRQLLKCRAGEDFPEGASVFVKVDPQDVICLPRA